MRNQPLDSKIDCISQGHHTWTATAGGYWCTKCHLFIVDEIIHQLRRDHQEDLNTLLELAADESTNWVQNLHFWSEYTDEL